MLIMDRTRPRIKVKHITLLEEEKKEERESKSWFNIILILMGVKFNESLTTNL